MVDALLGATLKDNGLYVTKAILPGLRYDLPGR